MSHYLPIADPTLIFIVVLCIILFAPIIMGKLRIPHIIGMVLAGVIVGEYGLNILERDDSFELFGKVGLYYIMFLAGLEIDMQGLKNNGFKVGLFGLLTFFVPFAMVYVGCHYMLGYSPLASVLLGAILGSNTLIAYPIVCKYGLQKHSAVTLCVGASMISLTFALVLLAAIVGSFHGGAGWGFWMLFILKIIVFFAVLLLAIPRLVRWFLRGYSDAVMQYIFVMSIMFLSAAASAAMGMEGVFGAFAAGLVLGRYIPHVSPLMSRLEFIGNAIFIPYFLIGVGMLIDMSILFKSWHTVFIVVCLVGFGTIGKAVAAYLMSTLFKYPRSHGHVMFGLTAAHAAGSIAIVMVGIKLQVAPGEYLLNNDMLNGVVMMILFTCIIGSMMTERGSQQIALNEGTPHGAADEGDDEKILIPMKYEGIAENSLSLAILMRNQKLNRGLIGLNVVFDDEKSVENQEKGKVLLDRITKIAAATDTRIQTQVRIATNIANGIMHAFKEYNASEIIMGMHIHYDITKRFWGEFIQSLFNGLNRQIIIARLEQPLNTMRIIRVVVPSRAEFEPGFHRWMSRLARLAGNLDCRIEFNGKQQSIDLIRQYIKKNHREVRAEYTLMPHWGDLPELASTVSDDQLFVVVTARQGTVSYKSAMERLPDELTAHFSGKSIMIVFPDQYGDALDVMTFAAPQHTEQRSAYLSIVFWLRKRYRDLRKLV